MTGPVDDPHERPTRLYEISADGSQVLEQDPESPIEDAAPQPWYRNRVLLALWALMVALLVTLIVYGVVELSRGGDTSVPTTSKSTSTTTPSSTGSPTTTPSTTTEDTPPPESPEQTPEEAPPPGNGSAAPAEPPHHHHHPHIPSTIQLPHTVITVPHGF